MEIRQERDGDASTLVAEREAPICAICGRLEDTEHHQRVVLVIRTWTDKVVDVVRDDTVAMAGRRRRFHNRDVYSDEFLAETVELSIARLQHWAFDTGRRQVRFETEQRTA